MKTSMKGLLAILAEEAVVLESYRDSGGVWTIGAGHTARAGGIDPKPGLKITLQQAMDILAEDLRKFEDRVSRAIKIPLSQPQFDALVSFDLNTGAIDHGTVDDKLNRGDGVAAVATLQAYNKDNGKVVQGLVDRREREAAMFQHGEYPNRSIIVYQRYPGTGRALSPDNFLKEIGATIKVPTPLPVDPIPVPPAVPAHNVAAVVIAALLAVAAVIGKALGLY